jgi:hypothetical protein
MCQAGFAIIEATRRGISNSPAATQTKSKPQSFLIGEGWTLIWSTNLWNFNKLHNKIIGKIVEPSRVKLSVKFSTWFLRTQR